MHTLAAPQGRRRRWRRLAVFGSVLLMLTALTAFELTERRPVYSPAREVAVIWQDGAWLVQWLHPSSGAFDSGLRPGDRVLAAQDQPLSAATSPAVWLAEPVTLTIERAGRQQPLALVEPPPRLGPVGRLAYLLAGLLFALTGVYTWSRSGGGRVQRTFLAFCSLTGLVLMTVPAAHRGHTWALSLNYLSVAAVSALLVFALSFPYIRPLRLGRHQLAPEYLWLMPAISLIAYLFSLSGQAPHETVRLGNILWMSLALVGVIVSVGQSWWLAHQGRDQRALRQLTIIGGGAVIGFLPSLLALLSYLIAGRYLIDPFLAVPATVLLPLSVAYAMLRYRVMGADLIVRRSLVRVGVAVVFAGALTLAQGAIESALAGHSPLLFQGGLVLALLVLVPLFQSLVDHLDRVVYGRGHDIRRTLTRAARELATSLDEDCLLALTLGRVLSTLQPELVAIYERTADGGYRPLAWQRRHESLSVPPAPASLAASHPGLRTLLAGRSWQDGGALARGNRAGEEPVPSELALLVPASAPLPSEEGIGRAGAPTWLLALAPRPSGLPYSYEDMALLEVLAQGLAAALANARHYGRLQSAYAELHAAHLQLVQAAKLAVLGEVAAGITHELRQPLTVMHARLQQLQGKEIAAPIREEIDRIVKQTGKMIGIIKHMSSFARVSQDERQLVALDGVVRAALELIGAQLSRQAIDIQTRLAPDLPPVLGDARQLEQVVVNLLSNARDALTSRPKRRITITTARAAQMPDWVTLSVADNGAGIDPATLPHTFEPFFTTKPDGMGTGLGLSISQDIVERHGGRLEVESTVGVGSTFRLLLPAAAAPATLPTGLDESVA